MNDDTPRPVIQTGDRKMVPHSDAIAKLLQEPAADLSARTSHVSLPLEILAQNVASEMGSDGWRINGDFTVKNGVAEFDMKKGSRVITIALDKAAFDGQTPKQVADTIISSEAGA